MSRLHAERPHILRISRLELPGQCCQDVPQFDILAGLKTEDSTSTDAWAYASAQLPWWIPAAGGMTAPLTPPANRACPALLICMAPTAIPGQLVLKLPMKLEPSLAEEGAVQSGPGPDLLTWCFACCRCRSGHIPSLETLPVSKGIDALVFFLEPEKPLRILLILFDLQPLFICLAYLHKVNYTLVYGEKQ